jgi:hypothetical protein
MGDTQLASLLLELQQHITAHIDKRADALDKRIDDVRSEVRIQNGRVGRLETSHFTLATKQRLLQRGSIVASLTRKQKAAFWGVMAVLGGSVAEGLHRVIPLVFDLLTRKVTP